MAHQVDTRETGTWTHHFFHGVLCAKAVAIKADATPRPLSPGWASRLRIRCTRQRCQVAR